MEEEPPPKDPHKVEEGDGGGGPSASASSPEFEFWRFRNFSFSETHLSPADQLFVDGVLLPLNPSTPPLPTSSSEARPALHPEPEPREPPVGVVSASKRWKDIFRLGGERKAAGEEADGKKKKQQQHKERRGIGGAGHGAADLNINIWPFSRSRSAGNGAPRPKAVPMPRKVSSAPCSRSNSRGESKSAARRLTPASPARGVHVGRGSTVWHVRRRAPKGKDPVAADTAASSTAGGTNRVRVLNLNVPMCMGYRQQMSCRSDSDGAGGGGGSGRTAATAAIGNGNGNGNGGGLFSLKTLFSKKVY